MWDGHLGKISITEHRINLIPDAKTFKSEPYSAGPKHRDLRKAEVIKQLEAGAFERTQSEWAALCCSLPKKTEKSGFVWTTASSTHSQCVALSNSCQ